MNCLNIESVENGFVVDEGSPLHATTGKRYAFETPGALAEFVADWGSDQESKRRPDDK